MQEWSAGDVGVWVDGLVLRDDWKRALADWAADADLEGDELGDINPKTVQKQLARAGVAEPKEVAAAFIALRDEAVAAADDGQGAGAGADRRQLAHGEVRVGPIAYSEVTDALGSGRFGFVFRCRVVETGAPHAVKRIDQLRFEAEGGKKEVQVLLHAQATDDGGHPNVIRYSQQLTDASFVYIVMELCDETLEHRIKRGDGFKGTNTRTAACLQLCQGLLYLHSLPEAITHRDLKPSNLLFKGDTLKIADMGQSRILAMGETAVPTGSQGGTMGWMSPEEIAWDNGGSVRGVPSEAHLSGDVHTAGSIVFYILTGGVHCFGKVRCSAAAPSLRSQRLLSAWGFAWGSACFACPDPGAAALA